MSSPREKHQYSALKAIGHHVPKEYAEKAKELVRDFYRIGCDFELSLDPETGLNILTVVYFPEQVDHPIWHDVIHASSFPLEMFSPQVIMKMLLELRVRRTALAFHRWATKEGLEVVSSVGGDKQARPEAESSESKTDGGNESD